MILRSQYKHSSWDIKRITKEEEYKLVIVKAEEKTHIADIGHCPRRSTGN